MKIHLASIYNSIVNAVSFNAKLRRVWEELNNEIRHPESHDMVPSHPNGFIKQFKKRRLTIADAYLTIANDLESDQYRKRLNALTLLTEQAAHSKALTMPLNAARVQIALMKEAVKSTGDKRRQLELIRDFSVSSFGQPIFIRRYLSELHLVEVPETGKPLNELSMGFDHHVHDNSSYGRKTPSQLIVDAFIKGISEITIAYNSVSHPEMIDEAIEAGAIMGIRVNIGLEFSAGVRGKRFHYMYLLPSFKDSGEFRAFLAGKKRYLKRLTEGLARNQENRIQSIRKLIGNFNTSFLASINEGFAKQSIHYLAPLELSDLNEIIPLSHATRMHLGELLYKKLKPVLYRRMMFGKALKVNAARQRTEGEISEWDYNSIAFRYAEAKKRYRELRPEELRLTYFANPSLFEYDTVFRDIAHLAHDLSRAGGRIKMIHPLEHGFPGAVSAIMHGHAYLDSVEAYNMYDRGNREYGQLIQFSNFIEALNSGSAETLSSFLAQCGVSMPTKLIDACAERAAKHTIVPAVGSDSTGRSTVIPGMGFIFEKDIPRRQRASFLRDHVSVPKSISTLIAHAGKKVSEKDDAGAIVSMGKTIEDIGKHDDDKEHLIPLTRAWRYLNPLIKNLIYIAIGFTPAFLAFNASRPSAAGYAFALGYAALWFTITGARNAIVDIIASRGGSPLFWNAKSINFDNLARSLFWTGFSVPLLSIVKITFDGLWPLAHTGMLYQVVKFFCICIVNGTYIFSHNMVRGFELPTARMNFFRSVLAWPFATLTGPVGDIFLIPSVVLAKFWSDTIGGIIEGSGKFLSIVNVRKRNLREILPRIHSTDSEIKHVALIDLMHIFLTDPRSRTSLKELLLHRVNIYEKLSSMMTREHHRYSSGYDDYHTLHAFFSVKENIITMTDFILERFQPEMATPLIGTVIRSFGEFDVWLSRHSPIR